MIKVEPPGSGDPVRKWRELDVDGTSPWFRSISRNKKSVTIDIRKPEGKECVLLFSFIFSLLFASLFFLPLSPSPSLTL